MSKHYHVITGLQGGYIPNGNEMYSSKRAAIAGAMWHVESYRDAEEKVAGNATQGYWEAREMSVGGFADYIEVTGPCFDACEAWED